LDRLAQDVASWVLDGDGSQPQRELAVLIHETLDARMAQAVDDKLYYLQKEVVDHSLYIDTSHPLTFAFDPSMHGPLPATTA